MRVPAAISQTARALAVAVALLWAPYASAFPWYVPTEELADQVVRTLEMRWPDHSVEVLIGQRPPQTDGFSLDEGTLSLLTEGVRHTRDVRGDITTAVVLARSWAHTFHIPDSSRVPQPTLPEAPPEDPEEWGLRLEVGIGLRDSFAEAGVVEGLNLGVRFDLRVLGVGLDVYVNLGAYNRLSAFDQELLDSIPAGVDTVVPVSPVDQFTIALFVDHRFGQGQAGKNKITVHPRVTAALELRRWLPREVELSAEGQTTVLLPSSVDLGPVLGLGGELWYDKRWGLRATLYDRLRFRYLESIDKSPLGQDFTLKVEFVIAP